jgi:hypothetical protein
MKRGPGHKTLAWAGASRPAGPPQGGRSTARSRDPQIASTSCSSRRVGSTPMCSSPATSFQVVGQCRVLPALGGVTGQAHGQHHVQRLRRRRHAGVVGQLDQQWRQPPAHHQAMLQLRQGHVQHLALHGGRAQRRITGLTAGDGAGQQRCAQPDQDLGEVMQPRGGLDDLHIVVHALHREGDGEVGGPAGRARGPRPRRRVRQAPGAAGPPARPAARRCGKNGPMPSITSAEVTVSGCPSSRPRRSRARWANSFRVIKGSWPMTPASPWASTESSRSRSSSIAAAVRASTGSDSTSNSRNQASRSRGARVRSVLGGDRSMEEADIGHIVDAPVAVAPGGAPTGPVV